METAKRQWKFVKFMIWNPIWKYATATENMYQIFQSLLQVYCNGAQLVSVKLRKFLGSSGV